MIRASFGITTNMTYQKSFWIWIWIRYFVNSAHTDMFYTSNESCAQELYFFFLHLRALSNLWGRYDPKTEKSRRCVHNWVISSHRIMCNASVKSFIQAFISFAYTDKLGAIYGDVMTKKHENLMNYRAFSSLIHRICSKRLVFETTN